MVRQECLTYIKYNFLYNELKIFPEAGKIYFNSLMNGLSG
jgi:hypothetical protein